MSAILQASINGGANASGGLTAADGDTVQLSGVSTVGWAQQRFEIYAFPEGFALPAGWSLDGTTGAYFYSTSPTCPIFTVTPWGKYLFRLTVNNGLDGNGVADPSLVDEVTAVSIPGPSGVLDLAWNEGAQFGSSKKWVKDQQANLRLFDAGLGSGIVPNTRNMIAGAGLTGGGTLAADRTFDVVANADGSIVVNANDVQVGILATDAQHGNRGNGTLHSVADNTHAGFQSAAHYLLVAGATATSTSNALALRDGSGGCAFSTVSAQALTVADGGSVFASDIALTPFTDTYAANVAVRGKDGGRHEITLTANITFDAPTNYGNGSTLEFFIVQGGAGGYTATWASGVGGFYFTVGNAANIISATVGDADYYEFKHRTSPTSHWVCVNHDKYTPP